MLCAMNPCLAIAKQLNKTNLTSDFTSSSSNSASPTGNTVTITPIPKNKVKSYHANFPMRSELPSGVQISMVTPLPAQKTKDTMKLSLDDIIIAGLERQPEATNYKCTKAFAEQFDQPIPIRPSNVAPAAESIMQGVKRHSLDTEHGSPGDSDYESSQEAALASTGTGQLPFKIRKNSSTIVAIKKNGSGDVGLGDVILTAAATSPTNNSTPPPAVASIDSRIQKSIKDFFITS